MEMIENEDGIIEFKQSERAHWFLRGLRLFCWVFAVPGFVYSIYSHNDDLSKFAAACIPAALFLWHWIWNFTHITYSITKAGVEESDKFIKEKTKMLPFNRIRQIELRETLIGKMLGYASIRFDSAGDSAAEIIFWNIDNAQEIKRIIEGRMQ